MQIKHYKTGQVMNVTREKWNEVVDRGWDHKWIVIDDDVPPEVKLPIQEIGSLSKVRGRKKQNNEAEI